MKNLFILHTQYNLIIGAGIALEYVNDDNILVLYSEFKLTESYLKKLKSVFSTVIVVRDKFEPEIYGWQEIKIVKKHLQKTKKLYSLGFDRVFLSQERRFDTLLAYKCFKRKKCEIIHIEEDAYYSLTIKSKPIHPPKITLKHFVAESLRRVVLGNNRFFDYGGVCYGASPIYQKAYLLFPNLAREELHDKKLFEVSKQMLLNGIQALYGDLNAQYPEGTKYLVVFFDLLERYKNKELVTSVFKNVILYASSFNVPVLVKYHPRETEKIKDIPEVFEIDQLIPGEKVLIDLKEKDVIVLGNATTVCTVAAKLNYKVYSIAPIDHPANIQMHTAMQSMGIHFLTSVEDINNIML